MHTVKLIGVKITEADSTEKGRLFNATSDSNFIVENCDITWSGICWLNGVVLHSRIQEWN